MTTEHPGGSQALLALARDFRHAISVRDETVEQKLYAYDRAGGERLDHAAKFLRDLQGADSAYEHSSRDALERYRETIEDSEGR
jgi:hypothetical protein